MNVVTRGVKNAFRSGVRSVAVILILAISMGLALSMLLANQAVKDRLAEVKQNVGTVVTINPAGSANFQGGGEPLDGAEVAKVSELDHVESVDMSLGLMVQTKTEDGSELHIKFAGGSGLEPGNTNLESSIDPGTLGHRFQSRGESMPEGFTLPIRLTGISGEKNELGQEINLQEGRLLQDGDTNSALVGTTLAEKNDLQIGSTFSAYDETFTVIGIFDAGTEFGNASLYIPLQTAQRLGEAGSEVSTATATIDSVDNVESATANIKETLDDTADVSASDDKAQVAVESLQSVERVSIIGFVVALGAAGVIIFLTMLMIVRERRREIGVLKAIGGSNRTIVVQFVTEAMVLVAISAVVGFGFAAVGSNSIANALVSSNTGESTEESTPGGVQGPGMRFRAAQSGNLESAGDLIGNVTTNVSMTSLGWGLVAALGIAVVGSAIPAWFITKIRPAEVLRSE